MRTNGVFLVFVFVSVVWVTFWGEKLPSYRDDVMRHKMKSGT